MLSQANRYMQDFFVFAYTYTEGRLSRNARKPKNLFKTGKRMKKKKAVQVNI